jgi:hypothetical protein
MSKRLKAFIVTILVLMQSVFLHSNFSEASNLKSQRIILKIAKGTIVDRRLESIKNLATSSSKLPVKITSKSPLVCSVVGTFVVSQSKGICQLKLSQAGNRIFAPAPDLTTNLVFYDIDSINLDIPASIKLSNVSVILPLTSKMGRSINYRSLNYTTCRIISNQLQLQGIGTCQFNAATSSTFEPYVLKAESILTTISVLGANDIKFALPQSMSLNSNPLKLNGISSSGLEVAYRSLTPDLCQVMSGNLVTLKTGQCSVQADQLGNQMYVAAEPIIQVTRIDSMRYTSNPQISSPGYRIQPVYVVPSDGQDNMLDLNGYITSIIKEGNDWLRNEIGRSFSMSTNSDGSTSVLFLKSRYNSSLLSTELGPVIAYSAQDVPGNLLREIGMSRNTNGTSSTFFIFFIDVAELRSGDCGYAGIPSNWAVVTIGNNTERGCDTRNYGGFTNYKVDTWLHETLHGLGIGHVNSDACDLMAPSACRSKVRLDQFRKFYLGSTSLSKIDILTLPIWTL